MKIIRNKIIPVKSYIAMTVWPFLFIRTDAKRSFSDIDMNHESIHARQQIETTVVFAVLFSAVMFIFGLNPWLLLLIPFAYYILYIGEFVLRLLIFGDQRTAYRNISAEQEAYSNEMNPKYLDGRKPFAHLKYMFKKTY